MTPERWQKITEVFEAALLLPPEERAAFVAETCGGDQEVRREVESMLRSHEDEPDFIEESAVAVAARQSEDGTSLVGQVVAHYQVLSRLGSGGMGDVYLARDTKLGRKVALKLLPDYLTGDERHARMFTREARAASALNHPNIVHIYDLGRWGGRYFIAMEYVEGRTLGEKIRRGRTPLPELLEYLRQVAEALTRAHAAGIVHRDLKPDNVMLTRDDVAKLLDFGLAKLVDQPNRAAGDGAGLSEAAAMLMPQSLPGMVMGTAGYMSPEQAQGKTKEVDQRSDIFSFGCILYEAATRRRAFEGEDVLDTMHKVVHDPTPSVLDVSPQLPRDLERIVRRCLAKDREKRYQSIKDVAIELEEVQQGLKGSVEAWQTRSSAPAGGARATGATAEPVMTASAPDAATPPASSAEYLVGGIKRHVRATLLILAALVVATAAVAYFAYSRSSNQSGRAGITSVAVLPFANASNNLDAEYLSDGISESLINSLSQLPGVKVIARSSSFKYKGKEVDPREVGRSLGVESVLAGRVMQRGDTLAISIELVDARDNTHVWGEQYERKLSDLPTVQQEISREVSEKLRLKLTGEERERLAKRHTTDAAAYELYLKGQYFLNKHTEADLKKGIEYFQQAIERDPSYALAYAGIGDAYEELGGVLGFVSPGEAAPQGKAAVMKALALDETLDEAHATLADLKLFYDWDWTGAEKEYRRAIELNPNNASAHSVYGTYLEALGRFDEAVAERDRCRQLDPVSAIATADVGYPLYYARRYDQALGHFRKGVELDPNLSWGHLWIGQVYLQQGRYDEAVDEIKKAIALSDGNVRDIATLGHAYALAGKRAEALKVLDELQGRARQKYVSPFFIALVYTGLGEKDQAFEWLEKAYEERHPYLILIKVEPVFDGLRSDPRFADLVRRVGLPQ